MVPGAGGRPVSVDKKVWRQDPANRAKENAARRARYAVRRAECPPYAPACVQGPSAVPRVAAGLELAGQSTLRAGTEEKLTWDIARRAGGEPAPIPEDFLIQRISQSVRGDGTELIRHLAYSRTEADRWKAFEAAVHRCTAELPALAPVPAPAVVDTDYMVVVEWGDPHLGMLAWGPETGADHDLAIGLRDLRVASRTLIDRAPPAEECVIVDLGDLIHAPDDTQRTPRSGHKLDVDTRWAKIWEGATAVARDAVDHALTRFARVRFVCIPGNHDPMVAFMLADHLRSWYRNEPRFSCDPARAPFQFVEFGQTLIGFAHGPSITRIERLPGVMITDQREAYGRTKFHAFHIGDIHHFSGREFAGVTVRSRGTMAPKDAWTNASGYRAEQNMTSTTYHRTYGRRREEVVTLDEVRALIAGGA